MSGNKRRVLYLNIILEKFVTEEGGKELRQKHNADLEVPKYLKQKRKQYI